MVLVSISLLISMLVCTYAPLYAAIYDNVSAFFYVFSKHMKRK